MTTRFSAPDAAERDSWLGHLGDREYHARLAAGLDCLRQVETADRAGPGAIEGWMRVAVWNVERCRDPQKVAASIAATGADVALLSEVDSGMARSGNRDHPAVLATALDAAYAFGVEFIELGPGDESEARSVVEPNSRGLHGNLILARGPLAGPASVRLDGGGDWFCAERGQPRVGGRMAVVAAIELDGVEVTLASVHLESASDAEERAGQLAVLLDALDDRGRRGPAIIGGDLNTFGASLRDLGDRQRVRELRRQSPSRFSWPVEHEPLFAAAAAHGFSWVDANVAAPTTRHDPHGLPDHPPIKLDWILVRGLEARRPTTVPAADRGGVAISDHEMIAVSLRLPRPDAPTAISEERPRDP